MLLFLKDKLSFNSPAGSLSAQDEESLAPIRLCFGRCAGLRVRNTWLARHRELCDLHKFTTMRDAHAISCHKSQQLWLFCWPCIYIKTWSQQAQHGVQLFSETPVTSAHIREGRGTASAGRERRGFEPSDLLFLGLRNNKRSALLISPSTWFKLCFPC